MRYTEATWPSDEWPSFSFDEMKCKHTGECDMNPDFMDILQNIRDDYGRPLKITSGYRATTHPEELKKGSPGAHSHGRAVDIAMPVYAFELVAIALKLGIIGIGISKGFIHLDVATHATRPKLWGY